MIETKKEYNVMYYPLENKLNKYIEISQDILKECGCNIFPICSLKDSFFIKMDMVILNWYDILEGNHFSIKMLINVLVKSVKLLIFRLRGIAVVNTFHNKIPHNTDTGLKRLALFYSKLVMNISNYLLVLSVDSEKYLKLYLSERKIKKKVFYIPHPNYIGVYGNDTYQLRKARKQFVILFVGQIRPYKNIEVIIECAKSMVDMPIIFRVSGMCPDEDYKKNIIEQIEGLTNVNVEFEFIPDEIIETKIRMSDIVLLPYDIKSSMNSGTVFLAFSNGVSVICPRISTIEEYQDAQKYAYDYSTYDEHLEAVKNCVENAYNDWVNNPDEYYLNGKKLRDSVMKHNSKEVLKEKYDQLLKKIVNS